jgi:NAD(P)-dependent dehydrogenase (short-subunit alcohol dehydrogenase family)
LPAAGARIVEQVLDRFGRVDSLINDAGIFIFIGEPFADSMESSLELP